MPKGMTKSDSSRIQSSQAKSGNSVGKDSFSSRAQSAGDKSANSQQSKKNNKYFTLNFIFLNLFIW